MKNLTFLCAWLTATLPCFLHPQSDPFAELAVAEFGKEGAARAAVERQIRDGGPAVYPQVEAKLLAALAQPGATPACQKFVCDTLRIVGSDACVGAMVRLLAEESSANLARLTLESLPGAAVDEALASAVKAAAGRTRIGLIQTLAARRHPVVVERAGDWLSAGDAELVRATLLALGRVGGADAVTILKAARVPADLDGLREGALVDAAFVLAGEGEGAQAAAIFDEQFRRGRSVPAVIAALNGLVEIRGLEATPLLLAALRDSRAPVALAAARASAQVNDARVTEGLAAALPGLPPASQVAALRALALRGDPAGLPAAKSLLSAGDEAVQTEAALALEKLGDASVVNDLVPLAAGSGPVAAAAQQTLGRLNAAGASEAIAAVLNDPDPGKVRAAALALKTRGETAAIPLLLRMAGSDQATLRSAALDALDGLAGKQELPALMTLLRQAPDGEREKVASALWKATRTLEGEDERFAKLWTLAEPEPEALKVAILSLASAAGGDVPLKILTGTLSCSSKALREAAVRTLCQWPNDRAVEPLAALVENTGQPTHRILATRAVVRLLSDRRCGWEASKKAATLERLLSRMEREEEKALIRGALAKFGAKK